MGLFSKKPKELEYDAEDCQRKKEIMRKMWNEAFFTQARHLLNLRED